MTQLHGFLIAFEMRKGGPSDMREATFKLKQKERKNSMNQDIFQKKKMK